MLRNKLSVPGISREYRRAVLDRQIKEVVKPNIGEPEISRCGNYRNSRRFGIPPRYVNSKKPESN